MLRRLLRWLLWMILALALLNLAAVAVFEFSEKEPDFDAIPADAGIEHLPQDFLLGAAVSSHQVEGHNRNNDWTAWEAEPGRIRQGQASGAAADHWNRVEEDIVLLTDLGANSFRFSIEWSRLEPLQGQWDEEAWEHYGDEISQLRAAGLEPMVTLLHFTLPAWLADQGGLTAEQFPEWFARFAAEAAQRFGDQVDLWCTLNEPNVHMYQSYVQGVWPPGIGNTAMASRAFAGMVRAHAAAAKELHQRDPGSQVGVAMNQILFEPDRRWWALDWVAAHEAGSGFNNAFYDSIGSGNISFHLAGFPAIEEPLEGLAGSADFFGINYYRRNLVRFTPQAPGLVTLLQGPGPLSDSGVEMYPEGLLQLIRRAWDRYGLPIYITENGVADASGDLRKEFLRSHMYAAALAAREGIPVRAYYHWSLMDNFEWTEGYEYRFGLYQVDFETFERTPGPAVSEFRRLADLLGDVN